MIKKLHYICGILLGLFIALHIFNHLMVVRGVQAHLDFMDSIRIFYRHPAIEPVILILVVFQASSGIVLLKKKWNNTSGVFDKLQWWSGLYFIYFLTTHTTAVLIGRSVLHLNTNLYFGAAPLNNDPLKFYFIFHYGLALLCFFIHVGCAHYAKMKQYISEKAVVYQSWFIILTGIVITIIILTYMSRISIPSTYHYLPFGDYN